MARNSNAKPRKQASSRQPATYRSADDRARHRGSPIDDDISLHLRRSKRASTVKPDWVDHEGAAHAYKIDASVKRRARLLSTNGLIPFSTRSMIRYALQIKDPYLVQIVQRVEAGEMTIDHIYL
ncbi:MAG TPA: hypothetical protein VI306_00320 [Pyrinomonadaceae bacterium]